jgi:hypothetical protein
MGVGVGIYYLSRIAGFSDWILSSVSIQNKVLFYDEPGKRI